MFSSHFPTALIALLAVAVATTQLGILGQIFGARVPLLRVYNTIAPPLLKILGVLIILCALFSSANIPGRPLVVFFGLMFISGGLQWRKWWTTTRAPAIAK